MRELELQLRAYGAVLDRTDATVTDVVDAMPRRIRRSYLVAIAAAIVVVLVASAVVVNATRSADGRPPRIVTPTPTTTAPAAVPTGVLAIGDSVMQGASRSLETAIPGVAVDAVPSRQFTQAVDVVKQYAAMDALAGTVIVDLGTNGAPTAEILDDFMRAVGDRDVYFVTVRVPREWEATTNTLLRDVPGRWPNAHVLDWYAVSSDNRDWFTADLFHLSPAGQEAFSLFVAQAAVAPPSGTKSLPVVDVIRELTLAPQPLAVAGGDVWIASKALGEKPSVRLERRDPTTAHLLDEIEVPQETVFAIAGDGDTLWVAGGGDGGVSETTVSKVDVRTSSVVFTKTLTGTPCSCPIVAGSAGVWLVGNGSEDAFHLASDDGHVIGRVHLANSSATSAMEIRTRLIVGLDNARVAVIDAANDRIERTMDIPEPGDVPLGWVTAMSPAAIPATSSSPAVDGLLVRSISAGYAIHTNSWDASPFPIGDFIPSTVVAIGDLIWVLGADRVVAASAFPERSIEFVYDGASQQFERAPAVPPSQLFGFRNAVAAEGRLWAVYDAGDAAPSIVVVRTQK